MKVLINPTAYEQINIKDLEISLRSGKGMAVSYYEGRIDGIVVPKDYSGDKYTVICFDGFSRRNSRYSEGVTISKLHSYADRIVYFDTLEEGFEFISNNL